MMEIDFTESEILDRDEGNGIYSINAYPFHVVLKCSAFTKRKPAEELVVWGQA